MDVVDEERTRTRAEHDALDTFYEQVKQTAPNQHQPAPDPKTAGVTVSQTQSDRLHQVRQAYRETVMAVPHYDEEYDDTLPESLTAEYGPDLATHVHAGDSFTPLLKQQLEQAIVQRRDTREQSLSTLNREAEALTAAKTTIDEIEDHFEQTRVRLSEECSFEDLTAAYPQLHDDEERCEELIHERQRQRARGHATAAAPRPSLPDLQTYLYRSLSVTYPVLADATSLLEAILRVDQQLARALTTRA